MSDIFKKREILPNPDTQQRIGIIQSKLDEIKKTKDEEIILPTSKNEEEWRTWLGKLTGVVGGTLTDGIIYFSKFIGNSGLDLAGSVATEIKNGLIPDSVQEFFAENKDKINNWVNKKRKGEKVTELVDEIYISGFSISKNSIGEYIIKDKNSQEISNLNLKIFNESKNSLSGVLNEVLISRSLTEAGAGGILDTIKYLKIDIKSEESIDNLTPEDLANAYIKKYNITKKDGTFYKLKEINDVVLNSKNIPNHIKDYILFTHSKIFQNEDMGFLKEAIKNYRDATIDSKGGIRQIKETVEGGVNNIIEAFKNPGEALNKINNPLSLLGLLAGVGYLLFFSEDKKTAWKTLLGIFSLDALVNIATGKSGLDHLITGNKKMFEWLDGDDTKKYFIEKITSKPNEGMLIINLTTIKASILFENFDVDNEGNFSIKNLNNLIPDEKTKKQFIDIFGSEELLKKTLCGTFESFIKLRKKSSENLKQTKQRLEKKYNTTNYPNAYFGEILCAELSDYKVENNNNDEQIISSTARTSTRTLSSTPQINGIIDKLSDSEKNEILLILSNYNGTSPDKNTLITYIKGDNKKDEIKKELKKLNLTGDNKIIIEKIIQKL